MAINNELTGQLQQLDKDGYCALPGIYDSHEISLAASKLEQVLVESRQAGTLRSRGKAYGSRNLLETFPDVEQMARNPKLQAFTEEVLGSRAGLVRVLYFDKPPGRSWSLPWHRDLTIAVKRNDLRSKEFRNPTTKAGVPHVEAPKSILETMLTLRIHLDAMHEQNGPLSVIPGSHRGESDSTPREIHLKAGDVFAMRPLISHSSRASVESTSHRRIIHLELAASPVLPGDFQWQTFIALR